MAAPRLLTLAAVLLLVAVVLALLLWPRPDATRPPAPAAAAPVTADAPPPDAEARARCASNLRQIGLALILYANEDEHLRLPPGLRTVADAQNAGIFCCRRTRAAPLATGELAFPDSLSYVYVGDGVSIDREDLADIVTLLEPLANHAGTGGAVGRASGGAAFVDADTMRAIVNDLQQAGRLTPADAATVLDVPAQ